MNLNGSKIKDVAHSNVSDKKMSSEIGNFELDDLVIENKVLAQIDEQSSNITPLRKSITRPSLGISC